MPGMVGLSDCTRSRKVLFTTEIAESYLTDHHGQPLRRLDIHYNEVKRRSHQEKSK